MAVVDYAPKKVATHTMQVLASQKRRRYLAKFHCNYQLHIFVGYATHMLPWGGITDWNKTSHGMHVSTARYVFTCTILKVEKPRIRLCLTDETKMVSLEDCRLVVKSSERVLTVLFDQES